MAAIHKIKKCILTDTTLRDGEQAPGVAFSFDEKIEIARSLITAGVREIEAGTIAMGPKEARTIAAISELNPDCRVSCWCRAKREDLLKAKSYGIKNVHFSVPVSSIHLNSLGKSEAWVIIELRDLLDEFRDSFDFISVGLQDASRADMEFVEFIINSANVYGADRVRLADTVGIWDPVTTYRIIKSLKRKCPDMDLSVHTHNDLGMATANAVAAIKAGAAAVDVSVNGLGERAGNAALEEVVMAMKVSLDVESGIDTKMLKELSGIVEEYSKRDNHISKPIVGSMVYTHESGIHVHGQLRDSKSYQPFAPEEVSAKETFVLGKHSGNASIKNSLDQLNIKYKKDDILKLLALIKDYSAQKKRNLTVEELRFLTEKVFYEKAV